MDIDDPFDKISVAILLQAMMCQYAKSSRDAKNEMRAISGLAHERLRRIYPKDKPGGEAAREVVAVKLDHLIAAAAALLE